MRAVRRVRMGRGIRNRFSDYFERVIRRLIGWSRTRKRALMLGADIVFIPGALWTALALKEGGFPGGIAATPGPYAIAQMASVPIFVHLGLYRAVLRYVGPKAAIAVVAGVSSSVVVLAAINLAMAPTGVPLSGIAIYWALALVYVGGTRVVVRNLLNARQAGSERVIIYGAGGGGAQVEAALLSNGLCDPVAFVDVDASMLKSVV